MHPRESRAATLGSAWTIIILTEMSKVHGLLV
jgi:hypothetical protein